jgi:hypothetical protein
VSRNNNDALAEWLRRVPAKYMGFPRESSNLSGVVFFFSFFFLFCLPTWTHGSLLHKLWYCNIQKCKWLSYRENSPVTT